MNNDTILTSEEILDAFNKPLPDTKELTSEELELDEWFIQNEANARKNYVTIPQRKNYLSHLLEAGYTPTLCFSGTKKSFVKEWQHKFWIEEKDEFWEKCEEFNYDLNYGILTGVPKYGNVIVIDFDIKQFIPEEQTKLISVINSLTETEYITSLIQSKKLFIEKSQSNGYHYVCSISDNTERQGKKLVDYFGRKKPNRTILIEHDDLGEVIETRGTGMHFVTFPSYGYRKIHNTIWELNKISTKEYDELEQYILDYFQKVDTNFTKAGTTMEVFPSKKTRVPKSEKSTTTIFDVVIEQLKKYQSTFSKSNKDINIISKLLEENGYGLISETPEFFYYIHPHSSKAEPNLALSRLNHCITNFSSNNPDFPTTKSVGTLTGFYILLGKKHSCNEIIQMLREDYNTILVRTPEEIYAQKKSTTNNKGIKK